MKARIKILSGILAIATLGTLAIAACNTSETTKNEQLVLMPILPEKENGNDFVESETQTYIGMSLTVSEIALVDYVEYNVSADAIKAYTIQASYAPSYVTIETAVDWSVSFVNPSSEWATGKIATNYITVTPESDGALTAMVECIEAFGSDILITVTLRANNQIKADCLCVYIHTDEDDGENPSGGSTDSGNTDSGNTDSGSTDSGNTGGGSSSGTASTDDRYDEIFEGNYASGQWGDKTIEMPVYNGVICLDDESYQNEFEDTEHRYFMICCVENWHSDYDFMQATIGSGATWASWIEEENGLGGQIGTTVESGNPVYAYIEDGNVYIEVHNEQEGMVYVYQIMGVNENDEIGWNFYSVEYVKEYSMNP